MERSGEDLSEDVRPSLETQGGRAEEIIMHVLKGKRHNEVVKKSIKKADARDLVAAKNAPVAGVNDSQLPECKKAEMLECRI